MLKKQTDIRDCFSFNKQGGGDSERREIFTKIIRTKDEWVNSKDELIFQPTRPTGRVEIKIILHP